MRPLSLRDRFRAWRVRDASLGGARAYSDEERAPGERLDLEVVHADGSAVRLTAQVAWVQALSEGAGARFDVGFRFLAATPEQLEVLGRMLQAGTNP